MEIDSVAAAAVGGAGVDTSLFALLCGDDGDDDDDDDDGCGAQGQGQLAAQERQQELQELQERNLLVLYGDSALTPPAHGSTNMQRTMEDAMPEYDRLERAVDG